MTSSPELCLDWIDLGGNAVIPAPPVVIVMVTYKRTSLAVRTVKGLCEHLDYPKNLRTWYIADDGSPYEHLSEIFRELSIHGETLLGYHNQKFVPGTTFCGTGWNRAKDEAHKIADYMLWMEDDWELRNDFDLRPYMRLLVEREDIGLVRLGPIAEGNNVFTEGHNGIHYVDYLKSSSYAYSGNPHLSHKRYWKAYGDFRTDGNPGEVELMADYKFRTKDGPKIWRPLNISPWGVFGHIGTERTFS